MRQGSEKRRETGRLSRSIGSASIDEDAPGEPEEDENDFMNPAEPSEFDPNKSTLQHRTPSNPRNSLLLLDHSHTQQHSTTIPGPENPIDDEVNHDLLRKMFSLTINEAGVAWEILQMSPANQQAAIVYSAISSHGKASQTQASSSDVHPIGVTKVQKIRLGDLIKTLMECKLDTYSLEHDTNTGEIIAASLLRMTNRFIAELSLHDKKSLLPTGFIDQNQAVLQAVREQIHETIKSEKGTLRGCLLLNIVPNSVSKSASGDVLTLSKLYSHIQQHLPYGGEFFTPDKIPLNVQVRFAYMRLETIIYAMGTSSARAAQWGPIDKQLQFLKTKGADYFIAWSDLIIRKDRYFFGSPNKFASIQLDVSVLPTEDDVQQAMATAHDQRNNT
ncbi:hypothetical protein PGT21_011326 [Puccinia graminis f. sp. tritici]|uniref:Uncharacterized protein n=1 Tax=Puccinia graminis f. sp. tritici TaxID=56615 RepID=A0A5B0QAD8_PUCGR|nr:hypothetical protein PGT21_011326 [Puccinia graminis f. sp. tritici]